MCKCVHVKCSPHPVNGGEAAESWQSSCQVPFQKWLHFQQHRLQTEHRTRSQLFWERCGTHGDLRLWKLRPMSVWRNRKPNNSRKAEEKKASLTLVSFWTVAEVVWLPLVPGSQEEMGPLRGALEGAGGPWVSVVVSALYLSSQVLEEESLLD